MMELDHLSYSSISTFLNCGKYWQLKYLEKIPTLTSPELIFGSAAHGAIESYLTEGKQGDLQTYWRVAYQKQLESNPDISWGLDRPEDYENQGMRIFEHTDVQAGIRGIAPAKDTAGIAIIEKKVELRVPQVPIPIVGYLDTITGDGVPSDFKTSKSRWTEDKALNEIQPLVYLAALNQENPKLTQWRFRHYIIVKTKIPQWQVLEHQHNPGQLMWLFKMIANVWGAIQTSQFFENPTGWKCSPNYCEYWGICRGKYA